MAPEITTLSNPSMMLLTGVLLLIIGIALTFWGKRIVEALAFIIFGVLGGILGIMLALFIIGFFGWSGNLYIKWGILIVLCLAGILIGSFLSKSFLYGMIVFYCAINAFFITWAFFGFKLYWQLLVAAVVAIVVAIVVKMLVEKLMAAVTAFLGATMVGYGAFAITLYVASRAFDKDLQGNLIFLGIIVVGIIILGIAGTAYQLSAAGIGAGGGGGAQPRQQPRQQPQRRR